MRFSKAQSAIEYLLTYGWMLLVVALVGGLLFSLFQDQELEGNSVEGFEDSGVQVREASVSSSGLSVELLSREPEKLENIQVCVFNSSISSCQSVNSLDIGEESVLSMDDFSESGESFEYDVNVSYSDESGLDFVEEGSVALDAVYNGSSGSGVSSLSWDGSDLDSGSDTGVVHESAVNTSYYSASVVRKGDSVSDPLFEDSLVAWYPLQESSGGTAYDFSGNDYDGTVSGATPGGGTNLTGLPTYGFDGVDDLVDTGVSSVGSSSGEYTIALWVRPEDVSELERFTSNYGHSGDDFWIGNNGGDGLRFNDDKVGDVQVSGELSTGNWYHIVMVVDGSTVKGYKNGVKVGEDGSLGSRSSPSQTGSNLIFGEEGNGNNFKGDIADYRLYESALTESEVKEIYDVFGSNSSHETVYKGLSVDSSPSINFTSVSVPSGSNATLRVLEDSDSDGSVENNDTIDLQDGVTDYTALGLQGSGELKLNLSLTNTNNLINGSSVEVPVEVSE